MTHQRSRLVGKEVRAIACGTVAGAPSGLRQSALSQAKPLIDYRGPSPSFVNLTRNTALESPSRFEPTKKGENDVVI